MEDELMKKLDEERTKLRSEYKSRTEHLNNEKEVLESELANNPDRREYVDGKFVETKESKEIKEDLQKINAELDKVTDVFNKKIKELTKDSKKFIKLQSDKETLEKDKQTLDKTIEKLEHDKMQCNKGIEVWSKRRIVVDGKLQKTNEQVSLETDLEKIETEIKKLNKQKIANDKKLTNTTKNIEKMLEKYNIEKDIENDEKNKNEKIRKAEQEEAQTPVVEPIQAGQTQTQAVIEPEKKLQEQGTIILGTSNEEKLTEKNVQSIQSDDSVEKLGPEDIEVVGEPKNSHTKNASKNQKGVEPTEVSEVVETNKGGDEYKSDTSDLEHLIAPSYKFTLDDLSKKYEISLDMKRKNFKAETEFYEDINDFSKIDGIKEIVCQVKLGLYLIRKTDDTVEYFDAKKEGCTDEKSRKKLMEEFSDFDKGDLKNVDLNILKILKENGFNNKELSKYMEGKNDDTRFRTVYKADMNPRDYAKLLKSKWKENIDADTKFKRLKLKEKNFFKKLTRSQENRLDTYILFNNKTLMQKIAQFFDRKILLDSGLRITDEELEKINPELRDERLLKEAHANEINRSVNEKIHDAKTPRFNFMKGLQVTVTPEQAGKNTIDEHKEDLIAKASKEAGIEIPTKKKEISEEQEQE